MRLASNMRRPGLPVGMRRRVSVRPSIKARVVRKVDSLVTRVQEWLEEPDKWIELVVAYAIIAMTLALMVAAVLVT